MRTENHNSVVYQDWSSPGRRKWSDDGRVVIQSVVRSFKTRRSVLVASCSSKCNFRNENEMEVAIEENSPERAREEHTGSRVPMDTKKLPSFFFF